MGGLEKKTSESWVTAGPRRARNRTSDCRSPDSVMKPALPTVAVGTRHSIQQQHLSDRPEHETSLGVQPNKTVRKTLVVRPDPVSAIEALSCLLQVIKDDQLGPPKLKPVNIRPVTAQHQLEVKSSDELVKLLITEDIAKSKLSTILGCADGFPAAPSESSQFEIPEPQFPSEKWDAVPLIDGVRLMGLRAVSTPATENCQVFAVAQALANDAINDDDQRLQATTEALKQGCQARSLIDFNQNCLQSSAKRLCYIWDVEARNGASRLGQGISSESTGLLRR